MSCYHITCQKYLGYRQLGRVAVFDGSFTKVSIVNALRQGSFPYQNYRAGPRTNTWFNDAIQKYILFLPFSFLSMVVAYVIGSLFHGFGVSSVNKVLNKGVLVRSAILDPNTPVFS